MSPSACHFIHAGNLHTRGKASSRSRRLLFFIGAASNLSSASPTIIFCLFLLLLFVTVMIQVKSRLSSSAWLLPPHTNLHPSYVYVLSLTSLVPLALSIFTLHLRNDGLPLASSIVIEGKGCEALDVGVGGFIIFYCFGLCGFSVELRCGF